jgi:hypothetical protein
MALLIIFILWYSIFGRNNPDTFRRIGDKLHKIIFWLIGISIVSSILPGLLDLSVGILVLLAVLAVAFGPFFLVIRGIQKLLGVDNKKRNDAGYGNVAPAQKAFTRAVPKRRKIVARFSNRYGLNLTEEEVNRIVDASYVSYAWEREIMDMDREYASITEWYGRNTNWLRAYLRAFPIQNVSSDFEMQRQICLDVFGQVFTEIQPERFGSVDECIRAINNRYMTAFDETIFMIAYRFLQSNGYQVQLPKTSVMRSESEVERLMHAYDSGNVGGANPRVGYPGGGNPGGTYPGGAYPGGGYPGTPYPDTDRRPMR